MSTGTATTFLSLPDELISAINTDAAGSPQAIRSTWLFAALQVRTLKALSLVCRRVGRVAQTCLHADIQVHSAIGLASLANTLHVRRDLRCTVKRLHIEYRASLSGRDDPRIYGYLGGYGGRYGGGYAGTGTNQSSDLAVYECAQRSLLSVPLVALKELSLSSMPQSLLIEGLAQAGATGIAPSLRKLQLEYSEKTDRVRVWKLVAAFPRLTEIAFESPSLPFPPMQAYPASLPSVQTLSLHSISYEPTVLETCTTPLASLFPKLTSLTLKGCWDRNHLERFLATTSRSLDKLSLPETTGRIDLSSVLTLFPHLEELRMSGAIAFHNAVPRLLSSRVRVLAFSGDAEVPLDALADLVIRAGNSSLVHIHLDLVPINFSRSSRLGSLGWLREDVTVENVDDLARSTRQRHEPEWTTELNPTSLTRLLNAAEAAGIRLTGRTTELLGWEDNYEADLKRLLVEQATEKDDYSVLVAYYGREQAMDAVRRHRPGQAHLWMPPS